MLDDLQLLTDETRVRLLCALEAQELAVNELCDALEVPQSTVSRHLKQLTDARWISLRREGKRSYYRLQLRGLEPGIRKLWLLLRDGLDGDMAARVGDDRARVESVLAARRRDSERFFAATAADWRSLREGTYGARTDLVGLLGLLGNDWRVGDLGCGTGEFSALVAPFVREVVAVDASDAMLRLAGERTERLDNVEVRQGDVENLPIPDASLDCAFLSLVLCHVGSPAQALAEVSRVLKAGGRLLLVDLYEHQDVRLQEQMGHVWMGFSQAKVDDLCAGAGLVEPRTLVCPPSHPGAPSLFVTQAAVPTAPAAGLEPASRESAAAIPGRT